ncbi:MAG: glycosyltransferase, partial [Candidatus Aminicenantes bacterium]|nr:glycosyltransferase [Candidatus Aminicenantes bacterium]
LVNRVKELDLQHNIVFHNRYVTLEQLVQFLVAADIYITPYLSKEQIVSGTLAYALACGKAVVSTPYWYAEELLAKGRGILVPFRNSKAIADKVCMLLENDPQRNRLRKRAYQFGRHMIWREVASRYDTAFEQAVAEYGKRKTAEHIYYTASSPPSIPEINLNHLYTLTDDTGILEHALFSTPSRIDGYTTDDNARALMVAVMLYQLHRDEKILNLIQTYLAFLNDAIDPKSGQVRNRMSYERMWSTKDSSEDCHGRALWSLGYTILYSPNESVLSMANYLFKLVIKGCESFSSPRAWAYSILGCLDYLQRLSGDTETNSLVALLGKRLLKLYKNNRSDEWMWFEESLSYANARLPQALIASGQHLGNRAMVKQGMEALEWLMKIQENPKTGYLSLIGNAGWYSKGGKKANFDQQPVEITGIIDACHQAYLATGQKTWTQKIEKAFAWFLGRNDKNEFLYDFKTGGCYDGLHRGGVNLNQGAESLLSWLSARHVIYQISHKSSDSPLKKHKRK